MHFSLNVDLSPGIDLNPNLDLSRDLSFGLRLFYFHFSVFQVLYILSLDVFRSFLDLFLWQYKVGRISVLHIGRRVFGCLVQDKTISTNTGTVKSHERNFEKIIE